MRGLFVVQWPVSGHSGIAFSPGRHPYPSSDEGRFGKMVGMNRQSKTFISILFIALTLAIGYAAGYLLSEPIVEVVSTAPESQTILVRDGSDSLALAKAQSEIAALKAELAALRKSLEAQPAEAEALPDVVAREEAPKSWRERMEEMKQKDPERFQAMEERRKHFQQVMKERQVERANFLDSIDLELLSEEGREVHLAYSNALARQAELSELMQASMEAGERPSKELMDALSEVRQTLRETVSSERVALMDAVATSMGLEGADAIDFRKLVDEVYSATSMRHGPPMPPPQQPPQAR